MENEFLLVVNVLLDGDACNQDDELRGKQRGHSVK